MVDRVAPRLAGGVEDVGASVPSPGVSPYTPLLFFLFRSAGLGSTARFRGAERGHRRRVSCRKPLAGNGCFIVAQLFESCRRSGGSFTAGLHS